MTTREPKSQDGAVQVCEQPDARVIDRERVLAHLQQQLALIGEQEGARNGDA